MTLYEVLVEETKMHRTQVEADSIHEAISKAVTGDCCLIETSVKPIKAKPPKKLGGKNEQG